MLSLKRAGDAEDGDLALMAPGSALSPQPPPQSCSFLLAS